MLEANDNINATLALGAFTFLTVSCLYYHRMPIPLCGKYIYGREGHRTPVPPPPPPPGSAPPPRGGKNIVTVEHVAVMQHEEL